jgi:hypothetical protein
MNSIKFSAKFKDKNGKVHTVYFGDKRYSQVKEYNPKNPERAIKQARTLLRHYKGDFNFNQPLVDVDKNGIPTPKAMVATIWGWHEPITTRTKQMEIVKYAEGLLSKYLK